MSALAVRELSPRGAGGLSVLELSGPGARLELERACGTALSRGALRLVRVRAGAELLDEALAWCESDERVELHLHGSAPLVRRVLELFGGETPAQDGSRIERALARAVDEPAARILLDQLEGALARELAAWEALGPDDLAARARTLDERSSQARFALEPARVVLAGPVNAGKSTLFNLLHGRERVIVSPAAGTTRDAVIERARIGAWPVELVDTAGERGGAADRLEGLGQELGRELRRSADLVLWLSPADAPSAPVADAVAGARWASLVSRADLAPTPVRGGLSVARDPSGALREVERTFRSALGLPEAAWTPGAPVAFDEATRGELARLRGALGRGELAAARAALGRLRTLAR